VSLCILYRVPRRLRAFMKSGREVHHSLHMGSCAFLGNRVGNRSTPKPGIVVVGSDREHGRCPESSTPGGKTETGRCVNISPLPAGHPPPKPVSATCPCQAVARRVEVDTRRPQQASGRGMKGVIWRGVALWAGMMRTGHVIPRALPQDGYGSNIARRWFGRCIFAVTGPTLCRWATSVDGPRSDDGIRRARGTAGSMNGDRIGPWLSHPAWPKHAVVERPDDRKGKASSPSLDPAGPGSAGDDEALIPNCPARGRRKSADPPDGRPLQRALPKTRAAKSHAPHPQGLALAKR